MISLHSHSGSFCHHALGTLEEVVQEAIRQGFEVYGLSEHAPRFRAQDLYPEEQHLPPEALLESFNSYVAEAHRLKQAYRHQIDLLVGAEIEYINDEHMQKVKDVLAAHGDRIEYTVGSVHHVRERWIDFDRTTFDDLITSLASAEKGALTALLEEYFDAQYKVLTEFRPKVIGHFDLCRLYYPSLPLRDRSTVWTRIERNIDFAVAYGALFEVNTAAYRKGWQTAYPGPDVLQAIVAKGGKLTLSDDSHGPKMVGLNFDRGKAYLRSMGILELWTLRRVGGATATERVSFP